MSQESLSTHLDHETNAALTEYAERYDLSESEAIQELVQTGLTNHNQRRSHTSDDIPPDHAELAQRQRALADRQGQIVRFQKFTVFGGFGWAVLTLATGADGPVWVAIGMLMIVLMASSTYIWQYLPRFR